MANKIYATGRRKASIAKVWLTPGTGNITINGLSLDAWLGGLEAKKLRVKQPLVISKLEYFGKLNDCFKFCITNEKIRVFIIFFHFL